MSRAGSAHTYERFPHSDASPSRLPEAGCQTFDAVTPPATEVVASVPLGVVPAADVDVVPTVFTVVGVAVAVVASKEIFDCPPPAPHDEITTTMTVTTPTVT
jgi:hypothetical protein